MKLTEKQEDALKIAFKRWDGDDKGYIVKEDLIKFAESIGIVSDEVSRSIWMAKFDYNKDGKVT